MILLISESKVHLLENALKDYYPSSYYSNMQIVGDVAIVSIANVLAKYGWGINPIDVIANIQAAIENTNVNAIMLYVDSPGGEAVGIEELANAVYDSEKPIVVFAQNMESAAIWIGSQADFIIAFNEGQKTIGSIGAMMVHSDLTKYYSEMGIKKTIIRAPESVDKNKMNPYEPLTAELRGEQEMSLSDLVSNHFIPAIKKGRGKKIKMQGDEPFTGKSYTASEAKDFGLIDKIGTLQDAYAKAIELGAKYKEFSSSKFYNV